MRIVFFDLDGTLTNSVEGIFKSLDFALTECGYPVPDKDVLQEFLGPPIVYSLQHFLWYFRAWKQTHLCQVSWAL